MVDVKMNIGIFVQLIIAIIGLFILFGVSYFKWRSDNSNSSRDSNTSENETKRDSKPKFVSYFIDKPYNIIAISLLLVLIINCAITWAKYSKFGVESVLNYNETYNFIISIASLITMIVIAIIQNKIQTLESEKSSRLQGEINARNNAYMQKLENEFQQREEIRKRQEYYNLVSDNMKKYITFTDIAEIEFDKDGFLRVYLFYKDGYSLSSFKCSTVENKNNCKIEINGYSTEVMIKSLKNENQSLVVELKFYDNTSDEQQHSVDIKKHIIDLVRAFFTPLNCNKFDANKVVIEFYCKITDKSLYNASSYEDNPNVEHLSWIASFNITLTSTQKVSQTGNLLFKSICKGGINYVDITDKSQ